MARREQLYATLKSKIWLTRDIFADVRSSLVAYAARSTTPVLLQDRKHLLGYVATVLDDYAVIVI